MVKKIGLNDIENMTPGDAVVHLTEIKKHRVKELLISDVLRSLDRPFIDAYYRDVFPCGVYLFFDRDGFVRYIGQSGNGFFHRFMAQFDPTPSAGWGWNVLLKKMGSERLSKPHHELTEDEHWEDLEYLGEYELLLIEIEQTGIQSQQHTSLERILLKAFRKLKGERLMNTRIGWLMEEHWDVKIQDLLDHY